ncbi:Pet127-domain-containing protein [Eremomyces bilateralis CBS 781.70]|uniref:Pet127-domain-containing protein n=1 Tax=Eremomyces bilateralis CBS 781.70 TaxID=1392243 RepID=A0A6G1G6M0_9PEZI|nr:Pet127-domain-containing protein [Eremomyces bilateralis CBS 781.70]KAF1813530.1 Pet127-domain-containing protein [Eremomyces bilateralis CBS 781.70]
MSLNITDIDIGSSDAPGLAHGLDRVLFNPGVYYLQDPRSRVYNFDPYLQKIMPAKEFNYGALTKYIVPSKDMTLAHLAKERNLRYYSSSSNMTSILEHLHFLLSQWRELNFSMLSKKFETTSKKFSKFSRGPTTVFLRWKNGVYAVDKSKDGQTPNIFGLLGHSLEKLLVLPADDYETYRRTSPALSKGVDEVPEGYHFSSSDKILLRSQLDAKDPRMPGTGVFDLKTRAVLSLRHAPSEKFEDYLGYELRQSQGNWMSYEREFHDMMRATMLKYSLQVRIGRMDGIFVAYHNVERLFGFQYVSLAEMDEAIHGQQDPSLGDQEFGMSLKVVDDIFDKATARFPEQSIRLSFETREGVVPFMYAFAEPVSETEIEEIQGASDQRQREYEASLFGEDVDSEKSIDENEWAKIRDSIEDALEQEQGSDEVTEEPTVSDEAPNDVLEEDVHQVAPNAKRGKKTSSPEQQAETPLLGFTVTVRNLVNGFQVDRPVDLAPEDSWKVEYAITELKESSARRYYALLTARRQALTRGSVDRQEDRFWFRHIRHYVEESKKWRRAQDRIDDRKGTVVFRPTHPNVSAHTLQELGKAREDSVDSYMAWLYGEKS